MTFSPARLVSTTSLSSLKSQGHNANRPAPPPIDTTPSRSGSMLRAAPETPSRSPRKPSRYASAVLEDHAIREGGMIEIPRFKRKDLNLSFVKSGWRQRLVWLGLIGICAVNALAGLVSFTHKSHSLAHHISVLRRQHHVSTGTVLSASRRHQ